MAASGRADDLQEHDRIRFKSVSGKIYHAQITVIPDDTGFEAGFTTKNNLFETRLIKWGMVMGHVRRGQPHKNDEEDWGGLFDSGPDEGDGPAEPRGRTPATASEETDNTPEWTSGSVDQGRLGSNNTGTPGICSMGGIGRPHNTVDNSAETATTEPASLPTASSESASATTRAEELGFGINTAAIPSAPATSGASTDNLGPPVVPAIAKKKKRKQRQQ